MPVVIGVFVFLHFLPLAAICPKNGNQYQMAVSNHSIEEPGFLLPQNRKKRISNAYSATPLLRLGLPDCLPIQPCIR